MTARAALRDGGKSLRAREGGETAKVPPTFRRRNEGRKEGRRERASERASA